MRVSDMCGIFGTVDKAMQKQWLKAESDSNHRYWTEMLLQMLVHHFLVLNSAKHPFSYQDGFLESLLVFKNNSSRDIPPR